MGQSFEVSNPLNLCAVLIIAFQQVWSAGDWNFQMYFVTHLNFPWQVI